jgi:hypothetical protein
VQVVRSGWAGPSFDKLRTIGNTSSGRSEVLAQDDRKISVRAELVEALVVRWGFDKLSPNGGGVQPERR